MDDPRTASIEVQHLRNTARQRLDEATRCSDTAQRDTLLHQAMAMLAEARRLRLADSQAMPYADHNDPSPPRRTEQS